MSHYSQHGDAGTLAGVSASPTRAILGEAIAFGAAAGEAGGSELDESGAVSGFLKRV